MNCRVAGRDPVPGGHAPAEVAPEGAAEPQGRTWAAPPSEEVAVRPREAPREAPWEVVLRRPPPLPRARPEGPAAEPGGTWGGHLAPPADLRESAAAGAAGAGSPAEAVRGGDGCFRLPADAGGGGAADRSHGGRVSGSGGGRSLADPLDPGSSAAPWLPGLPYAIVSAAAATAAAVADSDPRKRVGAIRSKAACVAACCLRRASWAALCFASAASSSSSSA